MDKVIMRESSMLEPFKIWEDRFPIKRYVQYPDIDEIRSMDLQAVSCFKIGAYDASFKLQFDDFDSFKTGQNKQFTVY